MKCAIFFFLFFSIMTHTTPFIIRVACIQLQVTWHALIKKELKCAVKETRADHTINDTGKRIKTYKKWTKLKIVTVELFSKDIIVWKFFIQTVLKECSDVHFTLSLFVFLRYTLLCGAVETMRKCFGREKKGIFLS